MAKQQSFADKNKSKNKMAGVNVKVIKGMKSEKNTIKFSEKFIRLDDVSKVTEIK